MSLAATYEELLRGLGIAPSLGTSLARRMVAPPDGALDGQDHGVVEPTRALLVAALVATYERREFGGALPALMRELGRIEDELAPYDLARARHLRALLTWRSGGPVFAVARLLNSALQILDALAGEEARAYRARIHDSSGQILHQRGALAEARDEFIAALDLRNTTGHEAGRAVTLGNLGRLCMDQGDFPSAVRYLREDLELVERASPDRVPLRAQLLSHIGSCEMQLGHLDAARDALIVSLELARDVDDPFQIMLAELGLGGVAWRGGDTDFAATTAEAVLGRVSSSSHTDDETVTTLAWRLLADALRSRGEVDGAIRWYHASLRVAESARDVSGLERAGILQGLAMALTDRGEVAAAAKCLRSALRIVDRTAADALRNEIEAQLRALSTDSWLLHGSGRFVGHANIDRLLHDAGREGFRGDYREVIVLFADVRGFTAMAENRDPQELVTLLNRLLAALSWCVDHHGGTVDKFIGDAVMAVFPAERHSDAAIAAALSMREEVERLNRAAALSNPLSMGIGIHAGRVVGGLIGSPQKRELTVIGDVVNTASRLEGMTKQLGATILVSEAVSRLAEEPGRWLLRPLGCYVPKGRTQPTRVFEVEGECDETPGSRRAIRESEAVVRALQLFEQREFEAAASEFRDLRRRSEGTRKSVGYELLEHAAGRLSQHPPAGEWKGEIALTEK